MSGHLIEQEFTEKAQAMSEEELQTAVSELNTFIENLEFENAMFEKFVNSVNGPIEIPNLSDEEVLSYIQNFEMNNNLADITLNSLNKSGKMNDTMSQSSKRSKTTSISSNNNAADPRSGAGLLRLTAEQKCDIVIKEIEDVNNEKEKIKLEAEKKMDNDSAVIDELKHRQKDIQKAHSDFERDMKNAVNERTKKYHAEKVQRYFDEKKRAKEALVKKLRLKTDSMGVQKKKVSLQLKQKEEMGEVLHEVDFNQLKIENQQYLEKIEDKNKELLDLKSRATNTTVYLNKKKIKTQELTSKILVTNNDIKLRTDALNRLMLEMEKVKKEEAEAECQLQKLKTRNEDFEVPPTKDYILQKSKVDELRQKAKTWRRKVEIAEMKLKTVRSNWRVLCNKQNLGEIHVEGLEGGAGDQQVGGGSGSVSARNKLA